MANARMLASVVQGSWRDFRQCWSALVIYEVAFKLLEAWLLIPAVAVALSFLLVRSGHVAISNLDVLEFLLTPLGAIYGIVFASFAITLLLLEQAGIMALVGPAAGFGAVSLARLPGALVPRLPRIIQFSVAYVAAMAVIVLPVVLLALATHHALLSGHDFYFYWKERPPVFWVASVIVGLGLLGALALAATLAIRWCFVLPILLFERQSLRAALTASRARVRGNAWRIGLVLLGWPLIVLGAGLAVGAFFRLAAGAVLEHAGARPWAMILLLLVVQSILLAAWSFALVVGLALLTRRLYLRQADAPCEVDAAPGADGGAAARRHGRWALAALGLLALSPLALWAGLSSVMAERPPVRVTAHRGHARAAPENTLSALRQAIASGADYAEFDLHQTADGAVVLLHDRDLKRVAGDSRRLDELTLEEARRLDVGSWFGPDFAGEQIPTLEEILEAARGRIKLNLEMKFFGPDRGLAEAVARILHERRFETDVLVTSLQHDGLVELKRHNPRLRTGLTIAHALGDVTRLDVDVLSVRADHLTDALIREAHRQGREVHAWTVNEPRQMAQLIQRGVDNLITSDPDLALRVRDEWGLMSGPERLLLSSRLLLGLAP